MKIIETKLLDVKLIEPRVLSDTRGFFMESYNKYMFNQVGILNDFVQDNHSLSLETGVVRGLHYQLNPKAQTKLVRVIVGAIYDVVVDIRKGSPTYGQWQGFNLSAENKSQLLIPKGFAHGFCTLVPNTELLYKVDELYSPHHDRGIAWNDPALGIVWPTSDPVLSEKDGKHPVFAKAENNFSYEG